MANAAQRAWFLEGCAYKPYFGTLMPVQLELFEKLGGFFAAPGLAVDANGSKVIAAGDYDPEEMASFLGFLDKHTLITDGSCPTGWRAAAPLHLYTMAPGSCPLPGPMPEGLTLDQNARAYDVAEMLFPDRPVRRDDFYAELCTKRNHGRAAVWALEKDGRILSTAGVYAMRYGTAYLACIQTEESLRGQGIGGWLTTALAHHLTGRLACTAELLCAENRRAFYTRLGFVWGGEIAVYTDDL